jgi:hypothetical protein
MQDVCEVTSSQIFSRTFFLILVHNPYYTSPQSHLYVTPIAIQGELWQAAGFCGVYLFFF